MAITAVQIEKAKRATRPQEPHHEHDDCIRIAYEWLDAQKNSGVRTKALEL